jgi:hypothetical protein
MSMNEDFSRYQPNCNIRIMREDNGEVVYSAHNVIVNNVKWLFARLMANANPTDPSVPYPLGHEPLYSVWGLALGAGSPTWAPETQPQETPVQTALIQEFLRKPLSRINFVQPDNSGGWTSINTLSTYVDFECVVNATTDNITQSIREMGLIGGGSVSQATNMQNAQTAPYFTGNISNYANVAAAQNTVNLINYKTLPPLLLPPGVNIIFSWVLSF